MDRILRRGYIARKARGRHPLALAAAIIHLVGAILLEQNDEWAVQRARAMALETIATMSNDPIISLPAVAG